MGHVTFTEMLFFQMFGRMPTTSQTAIVDACLVALMEHGMTPTALVSRMTYTSAPEAMQGAVAAGLLGVGSLFVGTMEGCGKLLSRIAAADGREAEARRVADEFRATRKPVPGFGHPIHKPDDPRSSALFRIAESEGTAGAHQEAVFALSRAVDEVWSRHVPINATGAVAATLLDAGVPPSILRGFAIVARAAGLVGHIHEEQSRPTLHAVWEAGDRAVPYDGAMPDKS
jgi:citrate synthase